MNRLFLFYMLLPVIGLAQNDVEIVKEYVVPEAKQAVAVDGNYFYVINSASITKHQKSDGKLVGDWNDSKGIIKHLNSGIIINDKLYACNSNYPESPMAGSIEVFNPEHLEHIDNHSFGIGNGSPTWLDKHNGFWYVAFAHYTDRGSELNKNNSWTRLVKFDEEWRQIESWIFPEEIIEKFHGRSNSGGRILPDGRILCTGHDAQEIYVMQFPKMGFTLEWIKTIPMAGLGQGIDYEKVEDEFFIYGINRSEKKVVVSKME